MNCDSVRFNGHSYKLREIDLGGDFGICNIASNRLNDLLIDDAGQYTSKEAEFVDEQIFYFVPARFFGLSDDALKSKILSDLK